MGSVRRPSAPRPPPAAAEGGNVRRRGQGHLPPDPVAPHQRNEMAQRKERGGAGGSRDACWGPDVPPLIVSNLQQVATKGESISIPEMLPPDVPSWISHGQKLKALPGAPRRSATGVQGMKSPKFRIRDFARIEGQQDRNVKEEEDEEEDSEEEEEAINSSQSENHQNSGIKVSEKNQLQGGKKLKQSAQEEEEDEDAPKDLWTNLFCEPYLESTIDPRTNLPRAPYYQEQRLNELEDFDKELVYGLRLKMQRFLEAGTSLVDRIHELQGKRAALVGTMDGVEGTGVRDSVIDVAHEIASKNFHQSDLLVKALFLLQSDARRQGEKKQHSVQPPEEAEIFAVAKRSRRDGH